VVGGRQNRFTITGAHSSAICHRFPSTGDRPPTTILFSGELILRDAEGLHIPMSLQHFNPVEVAGNPDEGARVRTVRVQAARWQDLAPLQSYFGSGHLLVKVIRREQP
jgi:hypothetical protein